MEPRMRRQNFKAAADDDSLPVMVPRARSVNGDPRRKDSPRLDLIGRGTAGPE